MESRVGSVWGRYAEAAFRREASRDSIVSVARAWSLAGYPEHSGRSPLGPLHSHPRRKGWSALGERMMSSGLVDSWLSRSSNKVSIGSTLLASRVRRLDNVHA